MRALATWKPKVKDEDMVKLEQFAEDFALEPRVHTSPAVSEKWWDNVGKAKWWSFVLNLKEQQIMQGHFYNIYNSRKQEYIYFLKI
jgi:hypothetical protein